MNNNLIDFEYKLSEEQKKEYFEEIFYNSDYLDLEELENLNADVSKQTWSEMGESLSDLEEEFEEGDEKTDEQEIELMKIINNSLKSESENLEYMEGNKYEL